MVIFSLAQADPLDLNKPHKGKSTPASPVPTQTSVAPRVHPRTSPRFYGTPVPAPGGHFGSGANANANAHLLRQTRRQEHRQERLNMGERPNSRVESVKFRPENHVAGSEKWQGQKYAAFRSYHAQWHDHNWWRHHHTRIILISGGW